MGQSSTVILGSGISGISAGYHLKKAGEESVIFEKNDDWGGLCGNFTIDGFRFDRFRHSRIRRFHTTIGMAAG